jgi:hypothetical protein
MTRSCWAPPGDYNGLGVYAVRSRPARTLSVMLINKYPVGSLNVTVNLSGFRICAQQAAVFRYGIAQDEAARTGVGSADVAQTTLDVPGSTFTFTPDAYSVTVLKVSKAACKSGDPDDDSCDN